MKTGFPIKSGMTILFAVLIAAIGAGCAVVSIKTPKWSAFGGHLFETPKGSITVNTNGTVKINYESKVDGEAIGTAAGSAIKAAAK